MKKIAIIGAGPTGIYTLLSLLKSDTQLSVSIYDQAKQAGIGMPYNKEENSKMMLANIASIEIPPIISTYLDWLKLRDDAYLRAYDLEKNDLHDRQFLPRILLGEYFRDQFLGLLQQANQRGFKITVNEATKVTDLQATSAGVRLWTVDNSFPTQFDLAVIATGHVWPQGSEATSGYFPSPWSGLISADIPASRIGIMGTSLSGLDAAMIVAARHGRFIKSTNQQMRFELKQSSKGLSIALMSRSGILPEADFYCPLPYQPLSIATEGAIKKQIKAGQTGLLDRVFSLIKQEISGADPSWSKRISLLSLTADNFAKSYFATRQKNDPFRWAKFNLHEAELNKQSKRTMPWRYAILRLHEVVQTIVPHLNDKDRARFDAGLHKVFVDNYAAIPSESIRRLLALRDAGVISIIKLGQNYTRETIGTETHISTGNKEHIFDIVVDARGQKPLKARDLPFPRLQKQLRNGGEFIPDLGADYSLLDPEIMRSHIAFAAIPFLMHDQPFVQGITASANIGAAIAKAIIKAIEQSRKQLVPYQPGTVRSAENSTLEMNL